VAPDLEAVILACLSKDPALRPQSAFELRRRLVGCGVEGWDGEAARDWWEQHRKALDVTAAKGEVRTIMIDRTVRASAAGL